MSRDNIVDPHAAAAKLLAGPVSAARALQAALEASPRD
jgi:hypothetical protein